MLPCGTPSGASISNTKGCSVWFHRVQASGRGFEGLPSKARWKLGQDMNTKEMPRQLLGILKRCPNLTHLCLANYRLTAAPIEDGHVPNEKEEEELMLAKKYHTYALRHHQTARWNESSRESAAPTLCVDFNRSEPLEAMRCATPHALIEELMLRKLGFPCLHEKRILNHRMYFPLRTSPVLPRLSNNSR